MAKEKSEEAEQGTKETKQKAKQKKTEKAKEAKVKTKNIRQEGEVSKVNSESGLIEKQATKIQNVLNEERESPRLLFCSRLYACWLLSMAALHFFTEHIFSRIRVLTVWYVETWMRPL